MQIAGSDSARIAVVSGRDPTSHKVFSGTTRSILRAIEGEIGAVRPVFPPAAEVISRLAYQIRNLSLRKVDLWRFSWFNRILAASLRGQLDGIDLVICVAASGLTAELGKRHQVVHISDTTFALMREFYPEFRALSARTLAAGEATERAAIAHAALVSVSSPWAADSVIAHYGKPAERVMAAPWGCNFLPVSRNEIVWNRPEGNICRLLFVGLDWQRKGGPIVIETARRLAHAGIPFRLDIVGAAPDVPPGMEQVHIHDRLDKANPQQSRQLLALFRNASFLLLPTRQDCTPMVFAEANAYAVPAITADVGGVTGVVRDGESGVVLPASAGGDEFAAAIADLWSAPARYRQMRVTSREHYENRLDWRVWARSLKEKLTELALLDRTTPGEAMPS